MSTSHKSYHHLPEISLDVCPDGTMLLIEYGDHTIFLAGTKYCTWYYIVWRDEDEWVLIPDVTDQADAEAFVETMIRMGAL